jgi:DNA phosphorothioation-associated putative methyltransferase
MRKVRGKIVNGSSYFHRYALNLLDTEKSEMLLKSSAPLVDVNWNVARINLSDPCDISFMEYEDFNVTAFPALLNSWKFNYATNTLHSRKYSKTNPPILHRKELLISSDAEQYEVYANLTKTLEELGAFKEMHKYGTKIKWQAHLSSLNIEIHGHTVYHKRSS